MTTAAQALGRCAELGRYSASPDHLTRVYLSPEHRGANDAVGAWMRAAGLETRVDAAGNIWGRRGEPGQKALVLGSHLDTVPDAGSYDGMLGVVMAIAVAERLREHHLPFALEVVGFSDEEGTRFGKALLGSQAASGRWEQHWWNLLDEHGVSLREAFVEFGLDPDRVGDAARRSDELIGYLEAHIEQGPELEAAGRSLGYVSTIAGARRFTLTVTGEARHAGGTPYARRRDALVGASCCIAAIERIAKETGPQGCIATVGRIDVTPGAVNVIPGRAEFTLDLRASTDEARDAMWETLRAEMAGLCGKRGLHFEYSETHSASAAPCASWLTEAVKEGIRATDDADAAKPMGLWSRAGHDAMVMATVTDIGMLFLRCHDGISHHPGEDVLEIDVARGLDALEAAVLAVSANVETAIYS